MDSTRRNVTGRVQIREVLESMTGKAKKYWVCGVAVFLVLYVGIPWAVIRYMGGVQNSGLFGDTFGFVNSLVSGFALLAVAFTIHQGQKQLMVQERELQENTKMLELQRVEMERQNEHLTRQEVENRFFQLIQAHRRAAEAIRCTHHQTKDLLEGQAALSYLRWRLDAYARNDHGGALNLEIWYPKFLENYGSFLGHYFRLLYHVVLFIDQSTGIGETTKRFYVRIVRAHLSDAELFLLFYNCLSSLGKAKFHPLVEKYDLLQNIDRSTLLRPEDVSEYDSLAHSFIEND